jgi:hypothetical protein
MMRRLRLASGIILILAGTVWALQGLNLSVAPQSVMTGDQTWVVLGAVAVLVGGGLLWSARSK